MLRTTRLYLRLLMTHVRASLEYEADFWLTAFGAALTQVVSVVFIGVVFARVPDLNGWSFWTVVLLFGMVAISEGVINLFFEGMWHLSRLKHEGELDYYLVRPYPVVLQVMSMTIGFNGLGNILTGGAMVIVGLAHAGIDWSVGRAALAVVLLVSALVTRVGIMLACNAACFWLSGPSTIFAFAVHQVGDLARFPLAIYPGVLKVVIGVVVPFAFVTFFPITYLTGEGAAPWLGLLTPAVAAYALIIALGVFRRGLLRYESAGN
jgi:ABC-2 type transport system permease protein